MRVWMYEVSALCLAFCFALADDRERVYAWFGAPSAALVHFAFKPYILRNQMRVLVISSIVPGVAQSGSHLYLGTILSNLMSSGVVVEVIAYAETTADTKINIGIEPATSRSVDCHCVAFDRSVKAFDLLSVYTISVSRRKRQGISDTVLREVCDRAPYDAVIVHHFRMAFVIEQVKPLLHVNSPRWVLLTENVERDVYKSLRSHHSSAARRLLYGIESRRAAYCERRYLSQYDAVGAITLNDAAELTSSYGLRHVFHAPPFVDLPEDSEPDYALHGPGVVYTGNFCSDQKKQNLLAFVNAWTKAAAYSRLPSLYVVGRADNDILDRVRKSYSLVKMTGWVDDVSPYYRECCIAVSPEPMGGGFKMKALDSMARGVPIIAYKGALGDPGLLAGRHFIEAGSIDSMVSMILDLHKRPDVRISIAKAAYDYLRVNYSRQSAHDKLMAMLTVNPN